MPRSTGRPISALPRCRCRISTSVSSTMRSISSSARSRGSRTKLLKRGRFSDFFTTLRPGNLHVVAAAGLQNLSLVRYLIGELAASPAKKFAQLRRYYPNAR
ncbi:malate:quinone oxidoreductase, partial [Burkholderia multivorans]|uniref:malate:quinone oxidoreductase n=1 Tax=Burkholderia multivorans TaxID=87883 RepID=UPI0034D2C76C